MPSAIRSAFSASVALAATGVIAVSPLAPAPEIHVPTVQIHQDLVRDGAQCGHRGSGQFD